MFSLPVALVGAFGGLLLTGNTFNMFSMIGMIMLMGLVAKNAILLVDFTNTLRAPRPGPQRRRIAEGRPDPAAADHHDDLQRWSSHDAAGPEAGGGRRVARADGGRPDRRR